MATDSQHTDNLALTRVAFFSLTQAEKRRVCNGNCGGVDLPPDLIEAGMIFAERAKGVLEELTKVPPTFGKILAEECILVYIKDMWQGINPIADPVFVRCVEQWRQSVSAEIGFHGGQIATTPYY